MTYSVFGGMLNLAQLNSTWWEFKYEPNDMQMFANGTKLW